MDLPGFEGINQTGSNPPTAQYGGDRETQHDLLKGPILCNPKAKNAPQFCPGGVPCPQCGQIACPCPPAPGPPPPPPPPPSHVKPTCGTAKYVCASAPGFSFFSPFFAKGANTHTAPYSPQSSQNAVAGGDAIQMFSKEQLPIKATLANSYGVFNRLFASVPGASMPNHLFSQSATSCGLMSNVHGGWNGSTCGGNRHGFPQRTIYDSLAESNRTFKSYINLTEVTYWSGGQSTGSLSGFDGINFPDTMMDGVARYAGSSFFNYSTFFADAAAGTLPNFAMVLPNASANDHPCHDIAKGERLVKDIYEALRAGPGWGKTLFLTVYDDTGALEVIHYSQLTDG